MSEVTIAASAKAFELMFELVRDNLHLSTSDSGSYGPFSFDYAVGVHLEGGSVQLRNDDTVEISNLDIVWNPLHAEVCFDLPGFCVGGWCIIPDPFDGCWVSFPKICIGGPVCLPLDLSGLVSIVRDLRASLVTRYYVDPARAAGISDLTAEFAGHPNKWQVFLDPEWVHVDPIDVPSTIADLVENAFRDAIESAFSFVPGFLWDVLWALLGPLLDLLTAILGIVGSIDDWVIDLLNNVFDLLGWIETEIADYFAAKYPIFDFEDPYPILDGGPGNDPIPVKIPIRNLDAHIDADEMTVTADVGP